MKRTPVEKEILHLHFGKRPHDIDSKTLGVTLLEIGKVLNEINLRQDATCQIGLRVRPFRVGSFDVPLELHPLVEATLFAAIPFLPAIQEALKTLIDFMTLKKMLRGKKPSRTEEKDGQIIITASKGSTINISPTTYNYFAASDGNSAPLDRMFKQLQGDESIRSLELRGRKGKKLFSSRRDEFKYLTSSIGLQGKGPNVETKRANLYVNKPVLDDKPSSWRFLYEGNPISAKMEDKDFLQRIAEGERFAMGDRLEVDLRIRQEFDNALNTYRIKSREIVKVVNHVGRPRQLDHTRD